MTKTGTVGTFGGAAYPTVTIFMDGFAEGVAYHNEAKGTSVKLIGWDADKQDGQFVGGNNPFGDIPGGKNTASTLISQGADIILPVAGPAGLGALQAAQESNGKVGIVWVDQDGYESASQYKEVFLTTVEKKIDTAVAGATVDTVNGKFTNEPFVGTLANEGVGLAPFHDWESKVPAELSSQVEALQQQIIAGEIKVESPNSPQVG